MTSNFIKFIECGVYKTEEQAKGIANVLLMATALTTNEYAEVVMAIEGHFNPPVAEPLQEATI